MSKYQTYRDRCILLKAQMQALEDRIKLNERVFAHDTCIEYMMEVSQSMLNMANLLIRMRLVGADEPAQPQPKAVAPKEDTP